jgi:hypothetical protein
MDHLYSWCGKMKMLTERMHAHNALLTERVHALLRAQGLALCARGFATDPVL